MSRTPSRRNDFSFLCYERVPEGKETGKLATIFLRIAYPAGYEHEEDMGGSLGDGREHETPRAAKAALRPRVARWTLEEDWGRSDEGTRGVQVLEVVVRVVVEARSPSCLLFLLPASAPPLCLCSSQRRRSPPPSCLPSHLTQSLDLHPEHECGVGGGKAGDGCMPHPHSPARLGTHSHASHAILLDEGDRVDGARMPTCPPAHSEEAPPYPHLLHLQWEDGLASEAGRKAAGRGKIIPPSCPPALLPAHATQHQVLPQ